ELRVPVVLDREADAVPPAEIVGDGHGLAVDDPGDEIGPEPAGEAEGTVETRLHEPQGQARQAPDAVGVDHETRHPRLGGDGGWVDLVAEIARMPGPELHVAQAERPHLREGLVPRQPREAVTVAADDHGPP